MENQDDGSQLVQACASGDWELVQVYIETGSNREGRSQDGKTPFLYACIKGNMNIVNLLMWKKANISVRDHVRRCWLRIVMLD